jgi:hypothetical protein
MGAGGGFDFLGAFPLHQALNDEGKKGITDDLHKRVSKNGVQPLLKEMRHSIETHGCNSIIVVDGGVDALMRGDEKDAGTLLEDSVTLCASAQLDVPIKILACLGFGTEAEEGLCHYRALENMSALIADGAFLGACAMTPDMEAFTEYKRACEWYWEEAGRKSHIHTRVIPAVMGQFDEQTMYEGIDARVCGSAPCGKAFVNPLMGIYWFFDLMKVYERNLFAKKLIPTVTRTDTMMIYRQCLPELMKTPRLSLPIPL